MVVHVGDRITVLYDDAAPNPYHTGIVETVYDTEDVFFHSPIVDIRFDDTGEMCTEIDLSKVVYHIVVEIDLTSPERNKRKFQDSDDSGESDDGSNESDEEEEEEEEEEKEEETKKESLFKKPKLQALSSKKDAEDHLLLVDATVDGIDDEDADERKPTAKAERRDDDNDVKAFKKPKLQASPPKKASVDLFSKDNDGGIYAFGDAEDDEGKPAAKTERRKAEPSAEEGKSSHLMENEGTTETEESSTEEPSFAEMEATMETQQLQDGDIAQEEVSVEEIETDLSVVDERIDEETDEHQEAVYEEENEPTLKEAPSLQGLPPFPVPPTFHPEKRKARVLHFTSSDFSACSPVTFDSNKVIPYSNQADAGFMISRPQRQPSGPSPPPSFPTTPPRSPRLLETTRQSSVPSSSPWFPTTPPLSPSMMEPRFLDDDNEMSLLEPQPHSNSTTFPAAVTPAAAENDPVEKKQVAVDKSSTQTDSSTVLPNIEVAKQEATTTQQTVVLSIAKTAGDWLHTFLLFSWRVWTQFCILFTSYFFFCFLMVYLGRFEMKDEVEGVVSSKNDTDSLVEEATKSVGSGFSSWFGLAH
jgi:hypothetical protein